MIEKVEKLNHKTDSALNPPFIGDEQFAQTVRHDDQIKRLILRRP
jgi:hypothetical protein